MSPSCSSALVEGIIHFYRDRRDTYFVFGLVEGGYNIELSIFINHGSLAALEGKVLQEEIKVPFIPAQLKCAGDNSVLQIKCTRKVCWNDIENDWHQIAPRRNAAP